MCRVVTSCQDSSPSPGKDSVEAGHLQIEIVGKTAKSAAWLAVLYLLLFGRFLEAAEPKQETLRAWDEYIRMVNLRVANIAVGDSHFLWIDESLNMPPRARPHEVIVESRDPDKVPQGLIHDWVGVVFVPNVTLDQALRVVENYDRYNVFYKPLFSKCSVLTRDRDQIRLDVVAIQKVFSVTAAVETEEQVQIVRLGPKRAYITSRAVRVQEIADYGQATEHPFPENRRPGFVWRVAGMKRLEERDGGVYVELESIVLSRGIPAELRWMIKPLVDELPRKLMLDVLNDTRTAVLQEAQLSASQGRAFTERAVARPH